MIDLFFIFTTQKLIYTMKNLKKLTRNALSKVSGGEGCINIYHVTSCGVSAVTCQSGWSGPRMMQWAHALEAANC
ncbi:bacteriocin-like protein [Chryseobacterium arthrosphaerae]|uniref:bacteriocin-like protein n=2 Tax=Chryseobacterium arthrosphaerae TaxID=651561 RepID=UPI001BAE5AA8|nr:hypothetical protein [Chryseobacterium arthrosphaerae]QUY55310.1 hypothetical protein I2F65_21010 [Chryseobacterium arthrosphaerae]